MYPEFDDLLPFPKRLNVGVHKIHPNAVIPSKGYVGDAGYDLYVMGSYVLEPHSFTDMSTGVCVKMPTSGIIWARITGRSSTVRTWGLQIQEGIIDSGYTGELFIGVWNLNDKVVTVPDRTRLAQLIFQLTVEAIWDELQEQPQGSRGKNGFGSTGW